MPLLDIGIWWGALPVVCPPAISEAESHAAVLNPAKPSRVVRTIRIVVLLHIVISFHVGNYEAAAYSVTEWITPTRRVHPCNQSTAPFVVLPTPDSSR